MSEMLTEKDLCKKTIKSLTVDGYGMDIVFTDGTVFGYFASDGGYSTWDIFEPDCLLKEAEPKHGRWIEDFVEYECSVCGGRISDSTLADNSKPNYCPNCGADMREVEE